MKTEFESFTYPEIKRGHLNLGGSNPKGERIDINSLYIERGGKPVLPVMGEYHFSRASASEWYDELCKMKAGGVNIVASYLFWIYHEEEEGKYDFSGDLDIARFTDTVKEAGLDMVLRIGPWAHGECRNGGFPDWLLKKGFKVRDNNPEYMHYVRIWFEKIYEQVKGRFYKDGGNIIAIQLDNELVNNAEHLLELKKLAKEIGFDVPIYTVTGWNSKFGAKIPLKEVLPVFGAYADAPWNSGTAENPLSHNYCFDHNRNDSAVGVDIIKDTDKDGWRLPYEDYPYATCEIGPGLQATHHRRAVVSGMDAYAMSLVKLGSGNNLVGYYMYHGGINKIGKLSTFNESKETGYPNDYTAVNYDFHTCLSSYGETREQYRLLNMLHMFLEDFGSDLAVMPAVMSKEAVSEDSKDKLRFCKRTDGKRGFVFVSHYQRHLKLDDINDVEIETEGVKFPKFNVKGDTSFFFPYNMPIGDKVLEYATAQPLCKEGDTYFFAEIPGIRATYKFNDGFVYTAEAGCDEKGELDLDGDIDVLSNRGTKIVTLNYKQARYLRKLDSGIYLGNGIDVYEASGEIKSIEPGDVSYWKWEDLEFKKTEVHKEYTEPTVEFTEVPEPFKPFYPYELSIGGERKLTWYKVKPSGENGFVEIPYEYDCLQAYADGKLVADDFYNGERFRIPSKMLFGKECYIVMSEIRDDHYMEKVVVG